MPALDWDLDAASAPAAGSPGSSAWTPATPAAATPDPGDPDPGGGTATCWTASNCAQVQAGRATTSGGFTYAKGSQQNMGLYNTFVTHTLKESPPGYFTLADTGCP